MQSSPRIFAKSTNISHPPSPISMMDLENQKTRLKTPIAMKKSVVTMDVRDSLMAEIRNAGGLRALRKTAVSTN
ncbi:hypothetical protein NECAME_02488 [Necator americanus]|uniref:WH2 domain-containing protein n=1 Tax=Necator americanus TaxID=51031 RepID=W2TEJ3_NECAM|nr:hypothetical protein NECAME_02488 [Necator americanus]ETN80009.1 hypothetical protein NECAME_02488 [Necator americanus]